MHQAVPLGATISEKLKRQIWANDFIELGKLLPEPVEKTLKPKTLQVERLSSPVHLNSALVKLLLEQMLLYYM
jgi:hypothetical protein